MEQLILNIEEELTFLRKKGIFDIKSYKEVLRIQHKNYRKFKRYVLAAIIETRRFLAAKSYLHKKLPLISVIIPAYNEEHYIEGAIISIKKQTYPNHEIIVGENFSRSTFKRSQYYTEGYVHTYHKGVSHGRNLGGERAKGEILVFMDADSRLNHDTLEKIYQVFLKNEELPSTKRVVGGTGAMRISSISILKEDPQKLKHRKLRASLFNLWYPNHLRLLHIIGQDYQFGLMFCTKEVFKHVQFDTNRAQGEDNLFLAGLKKYGKVTRINSLCGVTSDRGMIHHGYSKVLKTWLTGKGEIY